MTLSFAVSAVPPCRGCVCRAQANNGSMFLSRNAFDDDEPAKDPPRPQTGGFSTVSRSSLGRGAAAPAETTSAVSFGRHGTVRVDRACFHSVVGQAVFFPNALLRLHGSRRVPAVVSLSPCVARNAHTCILRGPIPLRVTGQGCPPTWLPSLVVYCRDACCGCTCSANLPGVPCCRAAVGATGDPRGRNGFLPPCSRTWFWARCVTRRGLSLHGFLFYFSCFARHTHLLFPPPSSSHPLVRLVRECRLRWLVVCRMHLFLVHLPVLPTRTDSPLSAHREAVFVACFLFSISALFSYPHALEFRVLCFSRGCRRRHNSPFSPTAVSCFPLGAPVRWTGAPLFVAAGAGFNTNDDRPSSSGGMGSAGALPTSAESRAAQIQRQKELFAQRRHGPSTGGQGVVPCRAALL
jgi:hypothetical protein